MSSDLSAKTKFGIGRRLSAGPLFLLGADIDYTPPRASDVDRTNGPILLCAQASRPEVGYSGKRPASLNGGPSEETQASLANVLGEQGML